MASDAIIVGAIAASASIIGAVGNAWNARTIARATANKLKADADAVAAETTIRLDSIARNVNGHATLLVGKLDTANATIDGLVDQLAIAEKLQRVTATAPAVPARPTPMRGTPGVEP